MPDPPPGAIPSNVAGPSRNFQVFAGPIPADFTLNRPTPSGMVPPHEKANSYSLSCGA
jgi:hypothetical protein